MSSISQHLPCVKPGVTAGFFIQFAKAQNFLLTKQEFLTIIIGLTGCGEVWYRAWFGTKRPRVRIPTLRPNPAEIFRFQPDFSVFSELFPMENSAHFPFDPNATQTGIRSGKRRKINFAACRSISSRRRALFCSFFHPTLAMKPLIFCAASFFMPAVTCVYTSSENSAEA